jgi:adenylate kinase family enzyme
VRRVAVVGCGGAGKSRLARELGRRLSLPVVHLDAHFWRPGWVATPDAEWEVRQRDLLTGDAWVADGNYHRTLGLRTARADTVVFLDMPRAACLRGVFSRLARQWGRVREDMGPGCPEGFDAEFLRWVWTFRRDVRPVLLEMLRDFERVGGRVITLRSRRETAAFLRGIPAAGTVALV